MTPSRYSDVLALLADYYDGLYRLDTARLREVFSPSAQYATIVQGTHLSLSVDEYLPRVEERQPPADTGTPYEFTVRSIRFAGDHTALAEVECTLFGNDYTDFLSLLRIDGRWRIQAKVFEGVPRGAKEVS
ncbi:MAG: hypothetical protein CMJ47_02120 [Planctomyces sp.]|nr:hypothetical protein [Planctomyces sp.]